MATQNGRTRALEAALDLVAAADLADVSAFVGMKQVARAVPVSPGTMTYYFGSREAFSREVFAHIFERFDQEWFYTGVDAKLARLAREPDDLVDIMAAVAAQVERLSPGPDTPAVGEEEQRLVTAFGVAEALLSAVAPNDPQAAEAIRETLARDRAYYGTLVEMLGELTGRAWRPGADPARFVVAMQGLVEGFLHVRRSDPGAAPMAVLADTLLRMYLSLTSDAEDLGTDDFDALHARFSREPLAEDQEALLCRAVRAATSVYARGGWNGLTIAAVAEEMGVDRIAVVRIFGDRRGLAAAIWAHRLPALRRVASSLAGTPGVAEVARTFLEALVEQARLDVALSAALLEGVFSATIAPERAAAPESLDPRKLVPLPRILAPLLEDRADQLSLEEVPGGLTVSDAAALLCNTALHVAFTRPKWDEGRVVDVVMATTFAGMTRKT